MVVGTRKQDQRFAGSRVMDNVPRISWEHRCRPSPLGDHYDVGRSELWVVPRTEYRLIPHRPLLRPSAASRWLLTAFERCAA